MLEPILAPVLPGVLMLPPWLLMLPPWLDMLPPWLDMVPWLFMRVLLMVPAVPLVVVPGDDVMPVDAPVVRGIPALPDAPLPELTVLWLDMPVCACAGKQNRAVPVIRAAAVKNRFIGHLIRSGARQPEHRVRRLQVESSTNEQPVTAMSVSPHVR
jgi:hypothetical protein